MPDDDSQFHREWSRGAVILSIDTEQRWGYLDSLSDGDFQLRYPEALNAHDKLLASLRSAGISATWFVVGGMALRGSRGALDPQMAGLPPAWAAAIPRGNEVTDPLWYRPAFLHRLRCAIPVQEIGLHGGLAHLIWTDRRATRGHVEWELAGGLKALEHAGLHPLSFSFAREQEAHHELLRDFGFQSYRGRTVARAHALGPGLPGAILRAWNELTRAVPRPVWPVETFPGLWNIPASLFLYPIGGPRSYVIPARTRIERFVLGIEAAARCRGIFHFCLHPENLAESPEGPAIFEDLLDRLLRFVCNGDIEVLTVSGAVARMERSRRAAGESHSGTTASGAGVVSAALEPSRNPDQTSTERNAHE
jgi:peptidoglycan/xylan/chitin deacetylase (PgdA/CDA1 family)